MANSNAMARADAAKNHVGAKMIVLDSAGDAGQVPFKGMVMGFVEFDGSASSIVARASANVSSITDLGVGKYQINFESPLATSAYAAVGSPGYAPDAVVARWAITHDRLTSSVKISTGYYSGSPSFYDFTNISLIVAR